MRLLAGTRLLTLTGQEVPGKTRLGLQLAAEASDEAPDGVFFVPLDAVRDPTVALDWAVEHGETGFGLRFLVGIWRSGRPAAT